MATEDTHDTLCVFIGSVLLMLSVWSLSRRMQHTPQMISNEAFEADTTISTVANHADRQYVAHVWKDGKYIGWM
jgi:hypothetical protein